MLLELNLLVLEAELDLEDIFLTWMLILERERWRDLERFFDFERRLDLERALERERRSLDTESGGGSNVFEEFVGSSLSVESILPSVFTS